MTLVFRVSSLATLGLVLVLGACGDAEQRALRGLPEFCQDVMPRVNEYLGGFEQPVGERYGGTVVLGGIGEMGDGMNALVSADHTSSQHQLFVNLMTLIQFDEDLQPAPYLAESWEVDDDNTEIVFHLRDDVYWHDGTPTTAHDVEFTYLRATDPETAFPNAAFWSYYVRGEDGVEVLDDHTVRLRLEPHAEFLDPWRAVGIMPRHLLEDVPPTQLRQHPFGTRCPVGNGPFVFQDHRADASWTFVRNPGFPEELGGPPYMDRYIYRIIPEQTTLLTELLTENVDVFINPPASQVERVQNAAHLEFRSFPFRAYDFVGWNARRPQLADARVRRALTLGTNRQQIVDAVFRGYAQVANAGVPPFHWAHYEGIQDSLQYNPDRARRLLDQAGWVDRTGDGVRENEDGVRLEISIKYNLGNQDRQDIAEIMQSQLRDIGVAVRPEVVEWATLISQINDPERRDFDGVVIGWVTELKVNDHDLFHSEKIDQPYGWSGTSNPELDRLLDALPLIVEREEAVPLWHEYQYRLVEEQPYTYLYFPERRIGLNARLQDVEMDVRGEWLNIADWWISQGER